MASRQLIIFCIHGEEFGMDSVYAKEIIRPAKIFKVPNAPSYIEGLINLRGKVHPVFNLRKRFNLPSAAFDDNTKFIMTHLDSAGIGFIADEVREIIRIEDGDIEVTPHTSGEVIKKFIKGAVKVGARTILLLDPENAFPLNSEGVESPGA